MEEKTENKTENEKTRKNTRVFKGSRKSSKATFVCNEKADTLTVNRKSPEEYFKGIKSDICTGFDLLNKACGGIDKPTGNVHVRGGGIRGQRDAAALAIIKYATSRSDEAHKLSKRNKMHTTDSRRKYGNKLGKDGAARKGITRKKR